MNNDFCTHKFKRGKREGQFCSRKIRTNLSGETPDFLCCKYSKKHNKKSRQKKKENIDIINTINATIKTMKLKIEKKNKKKRKPIKVIIGNPFFLCFNNILL